MKRTLIITGSLLLLAILILSAILYSQRKQGEEKNGFTRVWLGDVITPVHDTISPYRLSRTVNPTASRLFFTGKDPRQVVVTDYRLSRFDTILLRVPMAEDISYACDLFVDSPYFNIVSKNTPGIIQYNLDSNKYRASKLPSPLLTRFVPISSTTAAIRGFDKQQQTQLFQTINLQTNQVIHEKVIPEMTRDAGFASDGLLMFDNNTHLLVYAQIYQNTFYVLDTNLQVKYSAKTIDTTNTNQVHTRSFEDKESRNGARMPAVPLKRINKDLFAGDGYLFVISGLRADNEAVDDFDKNSVVDVYSIVDGKYKGSFYIPNKDGKKIKSFQFSGSRVITMYPARLAVWELHI